MITDLLLDHAALVPLAGLLLLLGCAGVGLLLAERPAGRRAAWVLAGLALLPVLALTLVPAGGTSASAACTVQFALPAPGRVELVANVALFVPAAFFATLACRRPLPVLAAAAGLSLAVEALQAAVPGLGRACDTNDWLMNSLGAALGVALAAAVLALVRHRAARRQPGAGQKVTGSSSMP